MENLKENRSCYASGKQRKILIELYRLREIQKSFFLTGGTALAVFYLFHRVSNDIDLFADVKVDFVHDPLSLKEKRPKINLENDIVIQVDSVDNIVSNKLYTIVSRSEQKDFLDFYFLLKLIPGLTLEKIYKDAQQKEAIFDDAPTAAYQIEENFRFVLDNPKLIPQSRLAFNRNEWSQFYYDLIQWIYRRIKPQNH